MNTINWVNNLKVIGIIAVVLGHIASPLGTFIYSWHMPLFFIISGFFINIESDCKTFLFKNFKRLLIPYFIFCFIGIFVEEFKRELLNRDPLDIINTIKNMFLFMDSGALSGHYGQVLWFLPTLFFSKIMFFLLMKFIRNTFLILLLCFVLFVLSFHLELFFSLDESMNVVIFILIGFYIYRIPDKFIFFISFLSMVFVFTILYFGNIPILDIANKNYGEPIVNLLWATCLIIMIISLLKKIKIEKVQLYLDTIGLYAMTIYLIHPYTNNIAHLIVRQFINKFNFDEGIMSLWYLKLFISGGLLMTLIIFFEKIKERYFKNVFKT